MSPTCPTRPPCSASGTRSPSSIQTDHIHLLFNNAGIAGGGSMVTDSRAAWERTFNVCWGGVYLGCRTFLPMLIAAEEGHIVNTSSVNGFWATSAPTPPTPPMRRRSSR
jgi:NADP-dependent 3-hydroxy acid dehydrogenase YdfG